MASHETENIFKQQQILLKPINKIGVASTWKETENRQLEVSETEAPLGGFLDQSMSTLPPQTTVKERGRTIRANHCALYPHSFSYYIHTVRTSSQ